MFGSNRILVIIDCGTSKTDIAFEPHFHHINTYPTLVAYEYISNSSCIHIGDDALSRAGAADLVWVKDAARISKAELEKHPSAFSDFIKISLRGVRKNDQVDLMMSEPILMTRYAREQILQQLAMINQIKRVYFLPESVASVFSADLKGRFILVDVGDGNTSVQAFNNRAPITTAARQTFRAGRTMTYHTAEVLREFFDIELNVTNAGSANYRYVVNLKHQLLSLLEKVQIIDQNGVIQTIPVTTLIQNTIINCLFSNKLQYMPVHQIIRNVAFEVKDLSTDLLRKIYVTGRPFTSQAILFAFEKELNSLLRREREALEIEHIAVKPLDCQHSVINGMRSIGKRIQEKSGKWIDLDELRES